MATNAQVAYQAAAVKSEQGQDADHDARVESYFAWLQHRTTTEEVQVVTEGGSGLTSFTLTFAGQTTGSIAANATAATVRTALEALSNVAPGDVVVTGSAGGPYTVSFAGAYDDTNVAQMTATPTGGTGTVTVTTQTAGAGAESATVIGNVQAALLAASHGFVHRTGADNVGELLARADLILADIAGHAAGQG